MDLRAQIERLERRMNTAPAVPFVPPLVSSFAPAPVPIPPVHATGIPLVPITPQAQFAAFPPAPVAPVSPVTAPLVPIACLRTADAPKYLGNNKKQSLEHWLLQLGIWMRVNQILSDEQRISTVLMQLKGGATKYCNQFMELAAQGKPLGTWENFVTFLQVGYRNMAPAWRAQEQIEAHCAKRHNSMTKFAEDFQSLAQKSGYSDVELIRCIDNQRSNRIRNIMISTKMLTPGQFPTNWQAYLDYVLGIKACVRDLLSTMRNQTQGSSSSKPADAMDVDAVCKAEKEKKPMNAEQRKWFDNGMCIRCGLHKPKFNKPCPDPKYKGLFNIPSHKKEAKKTETCAVDSQDADSPDSQSTAGPSSSNKIAALEAQLAALQLQVTTARIEEVASSPDFVQTL
jgi:hypothetical protein